MTNSSKLLRRIFPLCVLSLAGCGWFGGGSALTSEESLLRYVPADTPYVLATVAPLPDEISDMMSEYASSMREILQLGLQSELDEATRNGASAEELRAMEAVGELLSPESIEAMGINRESTYVGYGYGLLPVVRVTLAEGHGMAGILDNLQSLLAEQAGIAMQTASVAGQSYRYVALDQARLVLLLFENELALTVVPTVLGEDALASVLGLELPATSIAESGRLQDIADQYDLLDNMVGLLDLERITEIYLDPEGVDAVLFSASGFEREVLSDVCRNEHMQLAGIMPRVVGGYTDLDADTIAMNFIAEFREDIAQGLMTIPGAVAGLGVETDALMSFGMAFDIDALRNFVEARLDAMQEDPLLCETFAGMQQDLPGIRAMLYQPLPPFVDRITGFSATLDFTELDLANIDSIPEDLTASLVVATPDANALLGMAALFDPQIASLNLDTDGEIVELELPPPLNDPSFNPFGEVYFISSDSEIGIGLGANGGARLARQLAAPAADPSTFISMSLDMGAYYGLMADTIENMSLIDPLGAPPVAVVSSMAEMMRSLQAMYSRETVEIRFTEHGIEMPVSLETGR